MCSCNSGPENFPKNISNIIVEWLVLGCRAFCPVSMMLARDLCSYTFPHPCKEKAWSQVSNVLCFVPCFFKNSLLLQQFVKCMNECRFILTACKEIPQVPA